MESFLIPAQVAESLRIHEQAVRRLVREGWLTRTQPELRTFRISERSVRDFLASPSGQQKLTAIRRRQEANQLGLHRKARAQAPLPLAAPATSVPVDPAIARIEAKLDALLVALGMPTESALPVVP
jgi:hypothetical protein